MTEAVSGLDLVHLMIAIAGNNRLDVTQERVSPVSQTGLLRVCSGRNVLLLVPNRWSGAQEEEKLMEGVLAGPHVA